MTSPIVKLGDTRTGRQHVFHAPAPAADRATTLQFVVFLRAFLWDRLPARREPGRAGQTSMPGRIERRPAQELLTGVECPRSSADPPGCGVQIRAAHIAPGNGPFGVMRAERVGQRNPVGHRSAADIPDRTGRHHGRTIRTANRISARPTLQALWLRPQAASFNP
jgi:hypothetical protein